MTSSVGRSTRLDAGSTTIVAPGAAATCSPWATITSWSSIDTVTAPDAVVTIDSPLASVSKENCVPVTDALTDVERTT